MSSTGTAVHAAEDLHAATSNTQASASAPAVGDTLIEARNLVKNYGTTRAVNDLSFRVRRGEVVGFLGPNGAGKSTTMKMLTGYLKPTGGSASVAGFDVAEDALEARRRLGYLPENAPLYDDMMVVDFLRFIAELRGVEPGVAQKRLRTVAERCGLMDVLGKDIGALSKGYRQRVGLAQALVHDPDLLILDEPTSGLDPNQIVEIRALIRDLGRDKTVLLSTHILSEVRAVCSRAMIISGGRVVADDTPQALEHNGGRAQVAITFAGRDGLRIDAAAVTLALQALQDVSGVRVVSNHNPHEHSYSVRCASNADVRPALFALAVEKNWCVLELRREQASLEETFQRLTGAQHDKGGNRHAA